MCFFIVSPELRYEGYCSRRAAGKPLMPRAKMLARGACRPHGEVKNNFKISMLATPLAPSRGRGARAGRKPARALCNCSVEHLA
jgi:hypothetical protein